MRWPVAVLFAALVLAQEGRYGSGTPTAVARRKPRAIRKVDCSDRGGSFTISVPADWLLQEVDVGPEHQTAFELQLPDGEECGFSVIDHGNNYSPRGAPAWMLRFRDARPGLQPQVWGEPVPHLFLPEVPSVRGWGRLSAFVRSRGRTYEFDLTGHPAAVERAGADLLAVAATLKSTAPEWPPVTKDYRVLRVGEYRLAVHHSVAEPTERFEKSIRDSQRICDRLYGRMPPPASGEPLPLVYLHTERAQQEAILPSLKDLTTANTLCLSGLCVFAMTKDPIVEDTAANLVYTIGEFNTFWRWGTAIPMWVRVGERIVVANIHETGKDLPCVTAERLGWREGLELRALPNLTTEMAQQDWKSFYPHAFFYAVFFRAGPKSYRKAYGAFLEDVRRSCDPDGAVRRHLEPLGYDRLREETERFLRESLVEDK